MKRIIIPRPEEIEQLDSRDDQVTFRRLAQACINELMDNDFVCLFLRESDSKTSFSTKMRVLKAFEKKGWYIQEDRDKNSIDGRMYSTHYIFHPDELGSYKKRENHWCKSLREELD